MRQCHFSKQNETGIAIAVKLLRGVWYRIAFSFSLRCRLSAVSRLPSAFSLLLPLFAICFLPPAVSSAAYSVNQGLRFYAQSDYDAALFAFEEAEKQTPNDFRITYNQACTYLAAGRTEEAIEKFRRTAFAPDRNLIYESLVSLGNIAVDQAASHLSDPPENTTLGNRRRFLAALLVAEKECVDAIDILPNRIQAKENLETIRLWKNTLDALWKQNDQKIRAETLTTGELLSRIEQLQQAIYRRIATEMKLPVSPRKFQTLYLAANEQSDLISEIGLFGEKFQAKYSSSDRPRLPSDDREGKDRFSLLQTLLWVDELTKHIADSARKLKSYDGKSALRFQAAALEMLDAIENDLRDYPQLVRLAVTRQTGLVSEADKPDCDINEILWKQRLIYRGVQLFLKDAHREIASMPIPDEDDLTGNSPEGLLRESQQVAIALCPELERLIKEIFTDLEADQLDTVPPNLRQVRDLLRKILEPLDEIPQASRFSGNTGSQNSTSETDFFGEMEKSDSEEEDSATGDSTERGKSTESNSENTAGSQPSESTDGVSEGETDSSQQSLEELVDSFTENLSEGEEKSTPDSNRTNSQKSQGGADAAGGTAKSESPVDSKQPIPRRQQIADYDPNNRQSLTPEEEKLLQTVQEQANVLIRMVKRRQQDAENFRNQIRQLFEPSKEREPKDW